MRKLEKLTFFGAKKTQGNSTKNNWLKNRPWMKMSRIENGHFPAFSMLVLPKESTPMISEIPKDLESDVTEVHGFFLEGWIQRWSHVFGKMQNITLPEGKGYYRRKFRSLTSDNMQSWKSRVEMSSQQKEDQHACRVTRKKVHVRKMLGTSRIALFFQWFMLPDVRKVASLKRRVRRYLFDEKWHAAVARSTFSSQNAQNSTIAGQFWTFWCSKMARGCGAKLIFKSKCTKHHNRGPIFDVPMFKNGTRLWREAHFQVKMHKTHNRGPIFDVPMFKNGTRLWREAHLHGKMYKTPHSRATFWS